MSAIKDAIGGIREVLRMSDDIKRASDGLKALALEVREHDRRLVRLETMVEVAQRQAGYASTGRAVDNKAQ